MKIKSPAIVLKVARDSPVKQGRPWIFSGSVERVVGGPAAGETVDILAHDGEPLGKAAYSPDSQIRARMWTWDVQQDIDADFFRGLIQKSLELRRAIIPASETDALRLIHAESDGLPGLVADRYRDWLVVQILTAGAERWRDTLVNLLVEQTGIRQVYERSDVEVRKLEGLEERVGPLTAGTPERVQITENGLHFWVDLTGGQKTGFYIDQRANRQRLRQVAAGRRVLNCFCYTGAFSVYALAGGASEVLSVDSSAEALAAGTEHVALNGMDPARAAWQDGDVFQVLRGLRDRNESFDAIVLDPPKFAPTAAQVERATRAYKDINLLAFKLLRPGGLLFTFSCSGGISADLFQKIVAGAGLDAGVNASIIETLSQGPDHPVGLNFPEGAYLKGLICYKYE